MSAGLLKLKDWVDQKLEMSLQGVTVHLQGLGNEEIAGGGYTPQPYSTLIQWVFSGATPMIYGFYLEAAGKRIYGEPLQHPWRAERAGDRLIVDLTVDIKAKQKQ